MEYGSEFHWGANAPYLREADTGFVQPDWRLMRSGRDALKALAKLAGRTRVLLPALCCESMLVPFRLAGYEIVLYRLTEELRADEADVSEKLRDGDLLLTMPYFGIRPFRDAFLQSLRESGRGILIAEDRTQDALSGGPHPAAFRRQVTRLRRLCDDCVAKRYVHCFPPFFLQFLRRGSPPSTNRFLRTARPA